VLPSEKYREIVADAIARLGVQETARRLDLTTQTTLRLATTGATVRRGSLALAEANAHRLAEARAR
jgi:hypothetical protein